MAPGGDDGSTWSGAELDEEAVAHDRDPSVEAERYEVVGVLGRGGMGEVLRVRDRKLGREVALKRILGPVDDALSERFLLEIRATASLQHPGIVPVYEADRMSDGSLFYTMPILGSRTLADGLRDRVAPGDDAALRGLIGALASACDAVGYAHARGVVHRDLKPENIALGSFGEVRVLDWGIAKILGRAEVVGGPVSDSDPALTRAGTVSGTAAYMAPEQARGEVDRIGPPTDVYALGTVLFQILEGRLPYRGATPRELWSALVSGPPDWPEPPADGRRELYRIARRAMARQPRDRHPDAGALGAALRAWLDGALARERGLEVVVDAADARARAKALRQEAEALRLRAAEALDGVPRWADEADKREGWALEDRAGALEQEADAADLESEQALSAAFTHAPGLRQAHEALVRRYREDHAALEATGADARREAALLERHARSLPTDHPDRVEALAWLDGSAAITLRTEPATRGALVRYELVDRRRVPVEVHRLELAAVHELALPLGSFALRLEADGHEPVHYPVFNPRRRDWTTEPPEGGDARILRLVRSGELGRDDCYVPEGWFVAGGRHEKALSTRWLWADGFVVQRFAVTNRRYLAFLDDLVAAGRVDEADRAVPRDRGVSGAPLYSRDGEGRHTLVPDAEGDLWELDWPVLHVDWVGAMLFARWEAEKTGLAWRLPTEFEWEKAARGVDGRAFPWGDRFDPSRACTRWSHATRRLPAVVDSFPLDRSVYGVRGMAGNAADWCLDPHTPEGSGLRGDRVVVDVPSGPLVDDDASLRSVRGGFWNGLPGNSDTANRSGFPVRFRFINLGFRLARSVGL